MSADSTTLRHCLSRPHGGGGKSIPLIGVSTEVAEAGREPRVRIGGPKVQTCIFDRPVAAGSQSADLHIHCTYG
jgi:hypothetical protein